MHASERDATILELVRDHGFVRTEEVAGRLGVSRMTATRDFGRLEEQGLVRRTFGGAVLPSGHFEEPQREPGDARLVGVARAAAALVRPGELVLLDASRAGYQVAEALVERGVDVTVLTNGLAAMGLLAADASASVRLRAASGRLRDGAFVGREAVTAFTRCVADRAFLGGCGVASGRIGCADEQHACVARAMVAGSALAFRLDDGSAHCRYEIAPLPSLAGTIGCG